MAEDAQVRIIVPAIDKDEIGEGLRALTRAIADAGGEVSAGFLGGEDGYGGRWDSPVFLMHPYCWCEQEDCPWCCACYCETVEECERSCPVEHKIPAPNFHHKPSGVKVWWYKFIGRGMEVEYPVNRAWAEIVDECVADVKGRMSPA